MGAFVPGNSGPGWDKPKPPRMRHKPIDVEWPVLKSAQESVHEYAPSEDTAPHGTHTDPPCQCGLSKNHPDHK